MDKIDLPLDVLVSVIILIGMILVGILLRKRLPSYEKKRTESLKIFGPQVPLSSSPSKNSIPKFKESTGVMGLAFDEPLAGCLFGVNGLEYGFPGISSKRKATNIMEGNIGSIDFVTFDYSYSEEKEHDPDPSSGTAILFQSDQLSLPSFKWRSIGRPSRRSMEFQPKTPPRAQEEAGRKQCKTCGNWDVRWAMIEDGGLGDWCPNCKKSFCKMNEEKVLKLSKVMSYAYYPKWKALASNTQLLLYPEEGVDAEKYQEFMEEALKIFQLFQSGSQSLNEKISENEPEEKRQCPQCGNWDTRWAYIEDGGLGFWCDDCKKSLKSMGFA